MSKFKAGDKVVALKGFHTIKIGDILTVEDSGEYWFQVEECLGYSLYVANYELYKPQFKNMKFKVKSPEHSKEIQEALFEMGYTWQFWGREVVIADKGFPVSYWLYTDKDGILYRNSSDPSLYFVNPCTWQEYTLEITKSYKITPKPEVITIDGKTYDKEAVLKRLAELEEVK